MFQKPIQHTIKNSSIHDFNNEAPSKNSPNLFGTPDPGPDFDAEELAHLQAMEANTIPRDRIKPECLVNMNEDAEKYRHALFREEHMYKLLSILTAKDKSNALIVGEAGVGKTNVVEELARWLTVDNNPIAKALLKGYTLYELPITSLIAGKSLVGELEETVDHVIQFASNPENKAILFIDEIHRLMDRNSSSESKIAQMLKTALGRGKILAIGATTTQEATTFLKDPAFSRRWTKMVIPELTKQQTLEILKSNKEHYQNYHNVYIPDHLLEKVINISDEYKPYGSHRPDSALTLLDRALSEEKVEFQRKKNSDDDNLRLIAEQIEQTTQMPVLSESRIKKTAMELISIKNTNQTKVVDTLTERLTNNIIGQENVKKKLINTVERLTLNMIPSSKPRSFLFAGPSGTGKTEMAKQLAASLFGNEKDMIYLNMTEYSEPIALTRLIGSSDGYVGSDSKRELPFDSLESKPYQIVLLDEFEKAHPDIQRLFMQALDEGSFTTNRNKTVDFSRAIIIATTNAGIGEMSEKTVGFGAPQKKEYNARQAMSLMSKYFPIELLNRFQNIVFFDSISKPEYRQILAIKYNQLIQSIQNNRQNLTFTPEKIDINQLPSDEAFEQLVEESYDPLLNGRPAERIMQKHIENKILEQGLQQSYTIFQN